MILVLKNRKAINFYSVTLFLFCAHPCSNLYMKMRNEFCFFMSSMKLFHSCHIWSHIINENLETRTCIWGMQEIRIPGIIHWLWLSLWWASPGYSAYSDQQQALLGWDPLRTAYLKKTLTTVYLTGRFHPPKSSLALGQLKGVSIGQPGGGGGGGEVTSVTGSDDWFTYQVWDNGLTHSGLFIIISQWLTILAFCAIK